MAAVENQLARFTHTAFQVVAYDSYVELAEQLNSIAPISGPVKSALFTTGAEAAENCVKIARAATGRSGVIAFAGGFHGRTALGSALTGKVTPYKKGLGPSLPGIFHIPFPNETIGVTVEDSLRALDFVFTSDISPQEVAAIIIEPVQGEGGFNVAPKRLLSALRQICDAHGILLIADEVQSGFARTGKMFAIEHSEIEPDLIAIAKSLAGGFPLAGVIGRASIMDAPEPGGLGGTYGGSPVSCAAALAVIEIIKDEGLIERANNVGQRLRERMEGWRDRKDLHPIANVRGLGAMVAFDVVNIDDRSTPDGLAARAICLRAVEAGLIVLSCGQVGQTIRILVPLTTSDDVVEEGLNHLETALTLEN
jgi:4-aminobutyrate aminotransferase/(S)-3-amino-2-methylpropionate transaminase